MAGLNPLRVVIVDDDPLVLAGLRLILGGAPGITVVGEATDGQQAVDVVTREVPDVVLMDIRMPRTDGLIATRRLQERGSPARILILTTFDTDEFVVAALRIGAAGFLLKDTPPADLVAAVRRAALGEPMLSPRITTKLIAAVTRPDGDARRRVARALLARLTHREHEVAVAVSQGLTNTEIARALHMGVATVKTHVGNVFAKLEVTNRVQVARYVHDDEGT
ncbi:response regulator [Actinoplanes xinjiangensis]|uniref:LuxR family two component transcriptional regulator n=1 Tax=Actinoplanes xinjiangensis TaxID=512350 RepID=A0A316FEL3_9ACTN|nr:response regulator transcription factor [Actinoplanes xinjiangensis]PWK36070.1 LuxR family two component transcriptional regulator [Actinoplanes xinjiangensis]GIF42927.1 DNA-binding response regulator [Actinoplanes xinjiangensis]